MCSSFISFSIGLCCLTSLLNVPLPATYGFSIFIGGRHITAMIPMSGDKSALIKNQPMPPRPLVVAMKATKIEKTSHRINTITLSSKTKSPTWRCG